MIKLRFKLKNIDNFVKQNLFQKLEIIIILFNICQKCF